MRSYLPLFAFLSLCGVIGAIWGSHESVRSAEKSWAELAPIIAMIGIGFGLIGTTLVSLYRHYFNNAQNEKPAEWSLVFSALLGSLLFVGLAFLIGVWAQLGPVDSFHLSANGVFLGLATLAPMLLLLVALEKWDHPRVSAFREQQIDFFQGLGFELTPIRIVLLSLGAGIGEELLFRGAIQANLTNHLPIILAIAIPSFIFGILHSANRIYMALAGIISIYLGIVFHITGNILVPILAHTIYDIIAFIYTDRLIKARQNARSAGPEDAPIIETTVDMKDLSDP